MRTTPEKKRLASSAHVEKKIPSTAIASATICSQGGSAGGLDDEAIYDGQYALALASHELSFLPGAGLALRCRWTTHMGV